MPIDLEMLLSATRTTLFPFSPFSDDHRFSLTSEFDDCDYRHRPHYLLRSHSRRFGFNRDRTVFPAYEKPKEKTNSEDSTRKKKVSFADDRGLNLVEVREIPGAPKWTDDVLQLLIGGTQENHLSSEKTWKFSSKNLPWEDDKLIELLEKNNVALEMVNIQKPGDVFTGTLKVKNVAFEKRVFIRITFDRWLSYVDCNASYVKPKGKSLSKSNEYDTFDFSIKIPPSAMKYGVIEFCICFQCCDREYWDNNSGINYRLVADSSTKTSTTVHRSERDKLSENKITLSLTENIEKFSEIDSWSNFMYSQPYW